MPKESLTAKRARAAEINAILEQRYPNAVCALAYGGDPFRLLVMARLSAQCTDARVNLVSPALFARFPNAQAMAEAPMAELESLIRSCGLYKTKAASIKAMSQMLLDRFGGAVPEEMEDLLALPGVGRKIANLMRGDVFGKPAIVSDTHCIRIAARLGLTKTGETDPYRTELALNQVIPEPKRADFCHRIVLFGRDVCTARSPKCAVCPLRTLCKEYERIQKGR